MKTEVPRPLIKEANMVFFGCNTEAFTGEGKALLQVSVPEDLGNTNSVVLQLSLI